MKQIKLAGIVAAAVGSFFIGRAALATPFLQVDINGGNPATDLRPGEPGWSQWGGGADPTHNLPSNPSPNVPSISNSFVSSEGTVGVTISIGGTHSSGTINSRDRGNPNDPGTNGGVNETPLGYVYRDLAFEGSDGSAVQSQNYLEADFSGLQPNKHYTISLYSYDWTGTHSMNWSATAPTNPGVGYTDPITGVFAPPADEKTISWTTNQLPPPAPATLSVTTDATGAFSVWGWGGNGIAGSQNSDTSYINGFAIDVPEPASLGLLALAGAGVLARRRRSA